MLQKENSKQKLTKNRVSEIISKMGFKPIPSPEKLKELNMTMHRFNKIVENTVELSTSELKSFSAWLNVEMNDLFEN